MNILRKMLLGNDEISKYCIDKLDGCENELLDILSKMNSFCLYDSLIHGKNHSERVLLFSFLLAKYYKLNDRESMILMDAAWYHDIGRVFDSDDSFHGYSGAIKLNKALSLSKYNKDEVKVLKAIIDAHSRSDSKMDEVVYDYDISSDYIDMFFRLAKLLKDADALDRLRFNSFCDASLDPSFLRFDYSKELVDFALNINNIYKEMYRNNNKINFVGGGYCFHSVGFDFFKLDSILKYGILSADEMLKRDIDICKNFDGGNQDLWISVIDSNLVFNEVRKNSMANSKSGYLEFISRGISFVSIVDGFVDGYNKKDKDMALLLGVPYNKGNYYDERYVYKKIPRSNIIKIQIASDNLDLKISDLNYIYNRLSVEQIEKKILYFEKKISKNGIVIPLDKKRELLLKYDKILRETKDINKLPDNLYLVNIEINKLIQVALQEYFNIELNSSFDVTVGQVIEYVLDKYGLSLNTNMEYIFDNECTSYDISKKYRLVRGPKLKKR